MRCPLCDAACDGPAAVGSVIFEGQRYVYRQCQGCGSAACDPMPDDETLARMYGPAYADQDSDPCVEDPKSPQMTLDWLRQRPSRVFVAESCMVCPLFVAASCLPWMSSTWEMSSSICPHRSRWCDAWSDCCGLEGG